jgi:hypothetical protein
MGVGQMFKFAGVLIDHRRAVVVRGDAQNMEVLHIDSALEGLARAAKVGAGDNGRDSLTAGQREGVRVMQLRRYFDRIVDAIRGCNRFVILGPDDMKTQLRKHLDRIPDQAHRIVAVKTVKKMSDSDLVDEVTTFFAS